MFKNKGTVHLIRLITGENIIARFIFNENEEEWIKMIDPMIVYTMPPELKNARQTDPTTIEGALIKMFLGPYPTNDLVVNSEYMLNGNLIVTINNNLNPAILEGYHKIVKLLDSYKEKNKANLNNANNVRFFSADMSVEEKNILKNVEDKLGDINSDEYKSSLDMLNNALSKKPSSKTSPKTKNRKKKIEDDGSEAA